MKTKTLFRHFAFAHVLLIGIFFCSCETKNITILETKTTLNGVDIRIYVVDSCEYIGAMYGRNSDVLTHKGNCRFCIERSKK